MPMRPDPALEIWFLTGSQSMYGDETLDQVARQSQEIVATLDGSAEISVPIVWKPVLTTASANPASLPGRRGVGCLRGCHRLDAHVLAGEDVDRRPRCAAQAAVALPHPGQPSLPWAEIDMDFMNLNQAAHGDREFGYIETRMRVRRKSVVGHAATERSRQRIGTWARAAIGVHAARNLRLARFGDNMRDVAVTDGDKTDAQIVFGMSVNAYGVADLVTAVEAVPDDAVDALIAEYDERYDVVPALRAGGERHESLRYEARVEAALRRFMEEGGFNAFTTNFEDLGGLRQLPACPSSG